MKINQPKDQPEQENSDLQEKNPEIALTRMMGFNLQLTRIVWQLVQQLGGKATINPSEVDMLWSLKKSPVAGQPKSVMLESALLPDIEEERIVKIAQTLAGTAKDVADIRHDFNFAEYPAAYVELRLSRYIRFVNGYWTAPDIDTSVN